MVKNSLIDVKLLTYKSKNQPPTGCEVVYGSSYLLYLMISFQKRLMNKRDQ